MQPYNLSMKSNGSASPPEVAKPDVLAKSSNSALTESERNRAELARLSVELGLNRPEMFLPTTNGGSPNSLSEINTSMGLLAQWNSIILQHQKNQSAKVTAPADTSTSVGSYPTVTTPPVERKPKTSKPEKEKPFDEAVWYWLKQQQNSLADVARPESRQKSNSLLSPVSVSSSTNVTSTSQLNDTNSSSWFWKWYKQYAESFPLAHQIPDKPILYQQLTKDRESINYNSENINGDEEKEKSLPQAKTNKARAVLDNLLFNNNNNVTDLSCHKRESSPSGMDLGQLEAIEHGEKFLNWLECCSEPSVSAMQIMQFKYLLNNIKSSVDRKNLDSQMRCKVKRK